MAWLRRGVRASAGWAGDHSMVYLNFCQGAPRLARALQVDPRALRADRLPEPRVARARQQRALVAWA